MKYLLCCLLLLAPPVFAQDWKVDYGKSQVRFVIKQMNVPVEGGFDRFVGIASFDAARPEAGHFRVDLDINSIDTGSTEGDAEALRPTWFDAKRFPRATFVSKGLKKLSEGRYAVTGDLSVKGQVRTVSVPFNLSRQAAGAWLAEGRFPLRRSDFGIGGGDWNDVVEDLAEARFRLWLNP